MTSLELFAVDWLTTDRSYQGSDRFEISVVGKTSQKQSVHVRIPFTPYFFVGIPSAWSEPRRKYWLVEAATKYNALHKMSRFVERVSLLGFTNNTKKVYVQLAFSTLETFRKAKWALQKDGLQTYDASLDPLLRFFHIRDITPSSWLAISGAIEIPTEDPSKLSIETVREYMTDFKNINPLNSDAPPPLIIASWDIECVSETGNFPESSKPLDRIITIGTAYQRYGEAEPFHRSAIALDSCNPIEGVDVVACATEADVMNEWVEEIRRMDVDILIGYNTWQFDYKYVDGRVAILIDDDTGEPLVDLSKLGKFREGGGLPIEKKLASSAYGENNYFYHSSPGILTIDLLQIFRKELKLDSYSLNAVSKKYLEGEHKIDLKPHQIFQKFRGTAGDRADIAEYCVRDVELPLKLMRRMSTLENLMQMANAVCCSIEQLQTRGQQIRVFSQLMRKARALGFISPDIKRAGDLGPPEKYEGATVLDARKGAYFDPISALDFASLYPSIMRAHCMCPSTIVLDQSYANATGVEYYSVETSARKVTFAQNVPCVVPLLLEELAEFRKQAKRGMADAKERGDEFMVSMYNGKQLAYKVSMNSIYGFFGATRGMLPLVDLAAAVTATGRRMIMHSKALAEKMVPGTEVVYGDSVAEYTPLYIRMADGGVYVTTFEALAHDVEWSVRDDGKETAEVPPGMDIWSDCGWTPLHRIIRHALDPSKGMVRVVTRLGLVDVTTDHSLLLVDASPVKPEDVGVGTELLHHDHPLIVLPPTVHPVTDIKIAQIAGSIGHNKRVPDIILAASREIREAYWRGMCGTVSAYSLPIHQGKHLSLATIVLLADSLGYEYELCSHQVLFSINTHTPHGNKCEQQIRGMHRISYTCSFVYDVTTENHHFAAGIGRMVVHNTDSILCKFKISDESKQHDLNEHFRVAEIVAAEISKTFKHPVELEMEKIYFPYLLFTKKRYAGLMWTKPESPDYIDVKGLQLVRRDSPPLVKDVSNQMLHVIMYDRSTEQAIATARDIVLKVLTGAYPLEKFIVSKALRSGYKNPNSLPHVTVANKLRNRGNPPAMGERIPYIFIRDAANPDGLQAQRAEDPDYVKEHSSETEVDTLYYVKNQLLTPIVTLLDVLVNEGVDAMKLITEYPPIAEKMKVLEESKTLEVRVAKRVRTNIGNRQKEITSFFFKKDD